MLMIFKGLAPSSTKSKKFYIKNLHQNIYIKLLCPNVGQLIKP